MSETIVHTPSRPSRRWVLPIALAALLAPAGSAAAGAASDRPSAGAAGVGDLLYPELGNGGYDVRHYTLTLDYPTARAPVVDGTVTIRADSTQALSSFNLDFRGGSITWLTVDHTSASFTRYNEEIVVTPRRPIPDDEPFVVRVGFRSSPTEITDDPESAYWFLTADGSASGPQPHLAHMIFPSNDHPTDKAAYSIRMIVPEGTTASANGVLTGRRRSGGRTEWRYEQREPMASELLQVAVGDLDIRRRGTPGGVPVRDVTARRLTAALGPALDRTGDHVHFMQERVGRYPFAVYGNLVVDAPVGYALETQTLTLWDPSWFFDGEDGTLLPPVEWEGAMVHELAHAWFGNSVSPAQWREIWLSEGHATWYEQEYLDVLGLVPLEDFMRRVYARSDQLRYDHGPVARVRTPDDQFNTNVYDGGALVLYALRQEIGAPAFRRLERLWVERHVDAAVTTEDFIADASEVAGRDLGPFLRSWLYEETTPPMPGHPDWTVEPVQLEATVG